MKNSKILRGGVALRTLALLGAGLPASMMLSAPASAQDYTRGNIVGTVVGTDGAPVAGANVTVRSNEQGFSNTTTTDNNGTFRVSGLPTGTYTVVVESGGAVVVEDRSAAVVAGQAATFRYTAGTASADGSAAADAAEDAGEEVVITGTRVQVDDFAQTQTGATINVAELAQTVPISRDQTSLILLAPGTVSGDAGFGNLASIGGATIAENAYFVNGLNITDFRTFVGGSLIPFEFYRTIDVKTGGYPAEYGRALGGVTSAVTKSGSNNFEAGMVAVYNPTFFRETSPNTFLAFNETDRRESIEANFYVAGPIVKDRLFFYGLYTPRYLNNADSGILAGQRVRTRSSSPFFGGKIDAVITDGHRLEFTYFRDKQTQRSDFNTFDGDTEVVGNRLGTTVSGFGGDNFIGTYTGQLTDWFTVSAAYGENRSRATARPDPNIAFISSNISNASNRRVRGFSAGLAGDKDLRRFYRADADAFLNFLGEHHFRAGFDLEELSANELTARTGSGYDYVFNRASTALPNGFITRTFYRNEGGFETKQRAIYLQDAWSLLDNRVNLQLGVRNDSFKNYAVSGEQYYKSGDQWAPRLGASIDVFGDQRTRVNAFYGRYYLPIATNTNIRLGGAELFYRQRFNFPTGAGATTDFDGDGIPDRLTFNANGDPALGSVIGTATCPAASPNAGEVCFSVLSDGVQGPTDTLVSSTLAPSYTDEMLLGASHRIGGWTFGIDYIRRRLGETLEDVAIDAAVIKYCAEKGIAGCADVFTGFHQYVLSNPGSDITVRLDGDCSIKGQCDVVTLTKENLGYLKAIRKYDSVQFTVDKRFNGLFGFNGSYVYTDLRGNYEGAVKSDNNQTDAGLTQDFDQPGFQDGFFGDLANGRKHTFKLYGHIKPVKWLDIGANILVESPRKFSCIGNHPGGLDNFAFFYGAASFYCTQPGVGGTAVKNAGADLVPGTADDGTSFLVSRGTALKSDWNKKIDLGFAFQLGALGSSFGDSQFRVDVFNVLNSKSKLDLDEFGEDGDFDYAPSETYGLPTGFQAPRSVRFTLALRFGARGTVRDRNIATQD